MESHQLRAARPCLLPHAARLVRIAVWQNEIHASVSGSGGATWADFFTNSSGGALAFHESTGAPVTSQNPARPPEAVLLYLTNLPVRPAVVPPTGEPIDTSLPAADYTVSLGSTACQFEISGDSFSYTAGSAISYIRLAPASVGLYQMRLVVPQVKAARGDEPRLQRHLLLSLLAGLGLPWQLHHSNQPNRVASRAAKLTARRNDGARSPVGNNCFG